MHQSDLRLRLRYIRKFEGYIDWCLHPIFNFHLQLHYIGAVVFLFRILHHTVTVIQTNTRWTFHQNKSKANKNGLDSLHFIQSSCEPEANGTTFVHF